MKVIPVIAIFLLSPISFAKDIAAPCDGPMDSWNNCVTTRPYVMNRENEAYAGMWKDGKPNGYGEYWFSTGSKYEGYFENGQQHGIGVLLFPSGRRYVGEWEKGARHGFGLITYGAGSDPTDVGIWENNVFVRTAKMPAHINALVTQPNAISPPSGKTKNKQESKAITNPSLSNAIQRCNDLGLKRGTERFGECVLKLSR